MEYQNDETNYSSRKCLYMYLMVGTVLSLQIKEKGFSWLERGMIPFFKTTLTGKYWRRPSHHTTDVTGCKAQPSSTATLCRFPPMAIANSLLLWYRYVVEPVDWEDPMWTALTLKLCACNWIPSCTAYHIALFTKTPLIKTTFQVSHWTVKVMQYSLTVKLKKEEGTHHNLL